MNLDCTLKTQKRTNNTKVISRYKIIWTEMKQKTENYDNIEINKIKSWLFEKIKKMNKTTARIIRKKYGDY